MNVLTQELITIKKINGVKNFSEKRFISDFTLSNKINKLIKSILCNHTTGKSQKTPSLSTVNKFSDLH